jgi:hypothetical protein
MKPKKFSPRKKTAASALPEKPAVQKPESAASVPGRNTVVRSETSTTPGDSVESQKRTRIGSLKIPAILLEGDQPAVPPAGGTGQRYALGPVPPAEKPAAEGRLPDAYGTRELLLAALDPHWLYAHWDLTLEQQRAYNLRSADRHLILRLYLDAIEGRPAAEIHVHPESRHWFVNVRQAGSTYVASLGFYAKSGKWETISTSNPTFAPSDGISTDTSVRFATIPAELPLVTLLSIARESGRGDLPLAVALEQMQRRTYPRPPVSVAPPEAGEYRPAREPAPARTIGGNVPIRIRVGSLEVVEPVDHMFAEESPAISGAQPGVTPVPQTLQMPLTPAALSGSPSSPMGPAPSEKGFWFNVNAELIVYGATEPGATVTLGGRPVSLRPDGSFSCRLALPDGQFELPLVAVSADQTEGRAAEMRFSRDTCHRGDGGSCSPDPGLEAPEAAGV